MTLTWNMVLMAAAGLFVGLLIGLEIGFSKVRKLEKEMARLRQHVHDLTDEKVELSMAVRHMEEHLKKCEEQIIKQGAICNKNLITLVDCLKKFSKSKEKKGT